MTTISVIIPTYNRRDYLMECLASVAAQTLAPHEVIVVDDGSTDGTCEAVEGMAGVTLIRQANAGPGAARNKGAAAATGEYLAFLDSDDLWFPFTCEVFVEALQSHKRARFIVGQNVQFTKAPPTLANSKLQLLAFDSFFSAYSEHVVPVPTQSTCIERATFLKVFGFKPLFVAEDVDLWLRLGTTESFLWILDPPLSAQRHHADRVTHVNPKAVEGVMHLIQAEQNGEYPGGATWQPAREHRISAAARSTALQAAAEDIKAGYRIYLNSWLMNLRQGRLKFLFFFPLEAFRRRIAFGIRFR